MRIDSAPDRRYRPAASDTAKISRQGLSDLYGGVPENISGKEKEGETAGATSYLGGEDYKGTLAILKKLAEKPKKAENPYAQADRPGDPSGQLTRRLVAAGGQVEARQIAAEAGSSIAKLRLYAAIVKGEEADKAMAAVRRLEKLLTRVSRKIRDLDGEDIVKVRKIKAEKERRERRAEQLKQELSKKRLMRMIREHGYLREQTGDGAWSACGADKFPGDGAFGDDIATETEIALQAGEIAAAQVPGAEAAAEISASGAPDEGARAQGGGESAAAI
ncbi:MAG: hypothetical protein LBU86_03325 [Oscillospiraceae bacterium]|nr:hypothetical protein [Oscillospiraceae bacterium]